MTRRSRILWASLGVSLAAHGAGMVWMKSSVWRHDVTAKTDVPGEAAELALGLDVPPMPGVTEPAPPPPPPPPQPAPPPPTPEPQPAPPEIVIKSDPVPVETVPMPTSELAAAPASPAPEAPPIAPPVEAPKPIIVPPAPPPPTKPPALVASFAGVKADKARKVVYAVDVSGVMVSTLPFVFAELERCVARLTPEQEFQVVLFRDPIVREGDQPMADPPLMDTLLDEARWLGQSNGVGRPQLLAADSKNKGLLATLTQGVSASGPSNPLTGLRIALTLKPEVVFLLTRGIKRSDTTWGPGEEATLEALDRANPKDASGARATTIKTIQFLAKDPNGLMDAIAREHGGSESTVVTIEELRKSPESSPTKSTKPARVR